MFLLLLLLLKREQLLESAKEDSTVDRVVLISAGLGRNIQSPVRVAKLKTRTNSL